MSQWLDCTPILISDRHDHLLNVCDVSEAGSQDGHIALVGGQADGDFWETVPQVAGPRQALCARGEVLCGYMVAWYIDRNVGWIQIA